MYFHYYLIVYVSNSIKVYFETVKINYLFNLSKSLIKCVKRKVGGKYLLTRQEQGIYYKNNSLVQKHLTKKH
jgi:hypothetical protein